MKRIASLLLFTLMACGDSTRPATQQEVQAATAFLSNASTIRGSFDSQTFLGSGTSTSGCATLSNGQLTFNCQGLTGSITQNGSSYTFDVHETGTLAMDESGQLTVTDDFIDGNLSLDMSTDQISMATTLTFDSIILTNGCPTGRARL
jgi:hypothetical protein